MATESDLRDLLRDPDPEGRPAIDLDAVLTRARRRRRPKVVAAQVVGSVAAVGALFVGVAALVPPPQTATMVAEDSAGGAEEFATAPEAADADLRWMMDTCGEPPVEVGDSDWTLGIASTATGIEPSGFVEATATLRNDADTAVTGTATPWTITLVRDGIVVGHVADVVGYVDPADPEAMRFALQPGDSRETYLAGAAQACDPGSPLPLGSYEARAIIEIADDAGNPPVVVYGELGTVEVR